MTSQVQPHRWNTRIVHGVWRLSTILGGMWALSYLQWYSLRWSLRLDPAQITSIDYEILSRAAEAAYNANDQSLWRLLVVLATNGTPIQQKLYPWLSGAIDVLGLPFYLIMIALLWIQTFQMIRAVPRIVDQRRQYRWMMTKWVLMALFWSLLPLSWIDARSSAINVMSFYAILFEVRSSQWVTIWIALVIAACSIGLWTGLQFARQRWDYGYWYWVYVVIAIVVCGMLISLCATALQTPKLDWSMNSPWPLLAFAILFGYWLAWPHLIGQLDLFYQASWRKDAASSTADWAAAEHVRRQRVLEQWRIVQPQPLAQEWRTAFYRSKQSFIPDVIALLQDSPNKGFDVLLYERPLHGRDSEHGSVTLIEGSASQLMVDQQLEDVVALDLKYEDDIYSLTIAWKLPHDQHYSEVYSSSFRWMPLYTLHAGTQTRIWRASQPHYFTFPKSKMKLGTFTTTNNHIVRLAIYATDTSMLQPEDEQHTLREQLKESFYSYIGWKHSTDRAIGIYENRPSTPFHNYTLYLSPQHVHEAGWDTQQDESLRLLIDDRQAFGAIVGHSGEKLNVLFYDRSRSSGRVSEVEALDPLLPQAIRAQLDTALCSLAGRRAVFLAQPDSTNLTCCLIFFKPR